MTPTSPPVTLQAHQLQRILDTSPDWEYWVDANCQFVYVSPACETITGYPAADFVADATLLGRLVHTDDRAAFDQHHHEARQDAQPTWRELEIRIHHRDGRVVWLEHRCRAVFDDQGQLQGWRLCNRDITRYKQWEGDLREREAMYHAMFDTNNAVKLLIDPLDGRIVDANEAALKFYGYPRDHMLGMTISQINTLTPDQLREEMQRALQRDKIDFQFGHRLASGEVRQVEVHSGPLTWQGRRLLFSIIHDVTDRVRAQEELRQAYQHMSLLVAELKKHDNELTLINRLNDLLQMCQTRQEAHDVVQLMGAELFAGHSGGLAIGADHMLNVVAQWGDANISEDWFTPEECWALRRGQPHLVSSAQPGMVCAHWQPAALGGRACVPLVVHNELLGVLFVGFVNAADLPANEKLLLTAAETIKLSLANLRLRETLHEQATHDALTGLFNRRYLEDTFPRELHRIRRRHASLCVAMLDIDHFKNLNDTYGHEAGDMVLHTLGQLLAAFIRRSDLACRVGGEEFVIILPDITLDLAQQRLLAMCQQVRTTALRYKDQAIPPITLSVGVVAWPTHGDSMEELLGAADEALYQAKQAGRNRVKVWGAADSQVVGAPPGHLAGASHPF